MTAPTREDFDRWREDSVTRWVMKACQAVSEAQENEWRQISWVNGRANEAALRELRTRADAYRALFETDYFAWCGANNEEPNDQS